MILRIEANALGTVYTSIWISGRSDDAAEVAIAIEQLNSKVHRINDCYGVSFDVNLSWKVKLAIVSAVLSETLDDLAVLSEDINLVAQCVGHIDILCFRIDRYPGRSFKESFSLNAAKRSAILAFCFKEKDFP